MEKEKMEEFEQDIISEKKDNIGDWVNNNRWKLFGIIALCVAFLALYVSGVQKNNELLQEIRLKEQRLDIITIKNQELKYRITSFESPERINKIAIKKLDMVIPTKAPRKLR